MNKNYDMTETFRVWLREELKEVLGDNPENADYALLRVKDLMQISIEEVYLYISRKQWRTPQKTTAEMLEISRKSVLRALK